MMDDSSGRTYGVISMVLAGINALGVAAAVSYSLWVRRTYALLYPDLAIELPGAQRAILYSHWSLWVLGGLGLIALLLAKERLRWKRTIMCVNLVVTVGLAVYIAGFLHVMQRPLFELMKPL